MENMQRSKNSLVYKAKSYKENCEKQDHYSVSIIAESMQTFKNN